MDFKEAFQLMLDGRVVINETTKTVFKLDNNTLVCGKYTGDFNSVAFRVVGIIDTEGTWSEVVIKNETPRELLANFHNTFKELDNKGLFSHIERTVIKEYIKSAMNRQSSDEMKVCTAYGISPSAFLSL